MLCQGQLLSIAQYSALFSLLGTTYGGNGTTTFALPNLASRVPVGVGTGPGLQPINDGQQAGQESVTLLSTQMPSHNHLTTASATGPSTNVATNAHLASADRNTTMANIYVAGEPSPVMMGTPTTMTGGNQPHDNMMPFLTINYCIAVQGVFPSRN